METTNNEQAVNTVFDLMDDISQDFQKLKQHFSLNKNLQIENKTRFNNRVQIVIGHLLDILKVTDPNSRMLTFLSQCQDIETGVKAPQLSSEQLLEKVRSALEQSERRMAENQKKAFERVLKSVDMSHSIDIEAIVHSTFTKVVQRSKHLARQIDLIQEAVKAISLQCHSLTLAQFSNGKDIMRAVESMKINLDTVHNHLEHVIDSKRLVKNLHDIGAKLGIDFDDSEASDSEGTGEPVTVRCSKNDLQGKAHATFSHAEGVFQSAASKFVTEKAHMNAVHNLKEEAEDLAHKVITELLSCQIRVTQDPQAPNLHGLSSTILAFNNPNEYIVAKRRYGYATFKDGKLEAAESPENRKLNFKFKL